MSGIELPAAPELLDIARKTVLDELLPKIDDEAARFSALMVANALAIAARAMRADPVPMEKALAILGPLDALCADIRAGRHDPGSATRIPTATALRRLAEARCRISAPKALGG